MQSLIQRLTRRVRSATGLQRPAPAPIPDRQPVTEAPPDLGVIYGTIRERSTRHIEGWAYPPTAPGQRVPFEVVCTLPGATRVIATGRADQFDRVLAMLNFGDAIHAFRVTFGDAVTEAERDHLVVRPIGGGAPLPIDPKLRTRWEPITHVALDIVDNCNLRCPFCLYDYRGVNKTNMMSREVFLSALRLLPLVGGGRFWLSCLHEPTLHPQFLEFIDLIPHEYRDNVFFTTNLAKRMPPDYFTALAKSGLGHFNVSIESRDPAVYERMRKGARYRIFQENWQHLLEAMAAAPNPPGLRYIMMAYKSNLREIPDLVRYLIDECRASNVEVRDTYDVAHLPPDFRAAEFLDMDEWRWLQQQLSGFDVHRVMISLPPGFTPSPEPAAEPSGDASAAVGPEDKPTAGFAMTSNAPEIAAARAARIPGLFEIGFKWNGEMRISPALAGDYPSERNDTIVANILDIDDPVEYFLKL